MTKIYGVWSDTDNDWLGYNNIIFHTTSMEVATAQLRWCESLVPGKKIRIRSFVEWAENDESAKKYVEMAKKELEQNACNNL